MLKLELKFLPTLRPYFDINDKRQFTHNLTQRPLKKNLDSYDHESRRTRDQKQLLGADDIFLFCMGSQRIGIKAVTF